jgi:hypothetical protein
MPGRTLCSMLVLLLGLASTACSTDGHTDLTSTLVPSDISDILPVMKMKIGLPFNQAEFTPAVQARVREAIAAAMGGDATRVRILSIVEAARRRLLAYSLALEITIEMPSGESGLDTMSANSTMTASNLNRELVARNLPQATMLEPPIIVFISRNASNSSCVPPRFVSSAGSPWPDLRRDVSCFPGATCEIPVFARLSTSYPSSFPREISVMASQNARGPYTAERILRYDGMPCATEDEDAIACIFRTSLDDFNDLAVSGILSYCFVARASHASGVCRSDPWCIRIALQLPEEQLMHLHARAGISEQSAPGSEIIELSWTWQPGAPIPANFLRYEFQYARDGESFRDVPMTSWPASVHSSSIQFPARHVMEPDRNLLLAQSSLFFRVVFVTDTQSHVSLRSNQVRIFHLEENPGHLHIVTWESFMLRVFKGTATSSHFESVFEHDTFPVVAGTSAVDSIRNRLFAITAKPGDDTDPPQNLLMVDLDDPAKFSLFSLGGDVRYFYNTSIWNVEVDERDGHLLFMTVNATGFAVVTIDPANGYIIATDVLPCNARLAISAMDTVAGAYWFVDSSSHSIRFYNRSQRSFSEGIELCVIAPTACRTQELVILHLGFDCNRRQLHVVAGPLSRDGNLDVLTLVALDPYGPDAMAPVVLTAVQIQGSGFSSFAFDFARRFLFVSTAEDQQTLSHVRLTTYDMQTNVSSHAVVSDIGRVMDLQVKWNPTPVVRSFTPSLLQPIGLEPVTITGLNFGLMNQSPVVTIGGIPCNTTEWVSPSRMYCTMPKMYELNSGQPFSVSVDVGGYRSESIPRAGEFQLDIWRTVTPTSFSTLHPGATMAVSGAGFFAPFNRYRCAFSVGGSVFLSGPPVAETESLLEFNLPLWLLSTRNVAGDQILVSVDLLHASNEGSGSVLDRRVYHDRDQMPVTVAFEQMFGAYAPSTARSDGSSNDIMRIHGLGFNPLQSAAYHCLFAADDPMDSTRVVRRLASVQSHSEVVCVIPMWPYQHGVTRFQLLLNSQPIKHYIHEMSAPSLYANFTFQQLWVSASPSTGLATGGARITILGYGFNPTETYICRLTGLEPPHPSADITASDVLGGTPGRVLCDTTSTTVTVVGLKASVSLLQAGPKEILARENISPVFEFQPEWLSITPTQGTTAGGVLVTVSGAGLSNGTLFTCMFSYGDQQEFGDATMLPDGSGIRCISPGWSDSNAMLTLRIMMNTSEGVPISEYVMSGTNSRAEFNFSITQNTTFLGVFPTEAFAHANTTFSITGTGFDPTSTDYKCLLGLSGGKEMFVSAFALSASLVQCDPVSWNSSAATTWIKVARSSTPISEPLAVTFTQAVTTMSAQETLTSGGGSLTIFGGGFAVGGTYECDIRVQDVTILQVAATPESPNQFTCILGPINASGGVANVFVNDKTQFPARSLPRLAPLTFSFVTTFDNISLTSGTAAGGDVITVTGFGFTSVGHYEMTLHRAANELNSAHCSFKNPSRLECVTPSWTFSAGSVTISFSKNFEYLSPKSFAFDIIPVVVSLTTPSRTVAGTPSLALIAGHGFTPGASYDCMFSDLTFEAFNSANSTGQAVNVSHIKCVTPLWKFPAGRVLLNVIGAQGKIQGNELHFRFLSEAASMIPNHGILQGSMVTIRGAGLNASRHYACSVASEHYAQNLSASVSVFAFKQLTPAKYYNFELICRIPSIRTCEDSLLSVHVLDLASGELINGSFNFDYIEGLISIVPSAGPAIGGVNVTLTGCDFNARQPYRIVFRDLGASPSHFRMTNNASFINSTAISVELPYWGFGSALTAVGLIFEDSEDTTANLTFDIFPVVTSSLPKSGLVFGSYLLVKGHGFRDSDGFQTCLLQSQRNRSEVFEVAAFARGDTTEIECEIVRWPFATSMLNVTILYGARESRRIVPQIEGPITYELLSAWITADVAPTTDFAGGTPISIRGSGFNAYGGPLYTCHFASVDEGSCPVRKIREENGVGIMESDCTQAHSSDYTLPPDMRGPYVASSPELVVCFTPAWLKSVDTEVAVRLYEGPRLVQKVYVPSIVTTEFVGGPVVGPGSTLNSHAEGNAIITLAGNHFAFADISPRARVGPTACTFTIWYSNTQIHCRSPKGKVSTVDLSLTIGPYRMALLTNYFTYDGPTVEGVDNAIANTFSPPASVVVGVVLPLRKDEFNASKQMAYREAIAVTTSVNVTNVIILNITEVKFTIPNSTQQSGATNSRRLLSAGLGIEIDTEIMVVDETVATSILSELTLETLTATLQNASVLTQFQTVVLSSKPMVRVGAKPEVLGIGNSGSRAVQMVLVRGRYFVPSGTARIGGSACSASIWQSDSKILCKTADAVGNFEAIAVTIERVVNTREGIFTFDSPALSWNHSASTPLNIHTQLSTPLTTNGRNFGASADYTPRGVFGGTALMVTNWVSDSTIICSASAGISASMRVTVTSGSEIKGSASDALSYDIPGARLAGNAVQHAPKSLDIKAIHLGSFQTSLRARLGDTGTERSLWVSTTSMSARSALGNAASLRIVLSVGSAPGSASNCISFDRPGVQYAHEMIDEGVRIAGVPFSRSGRGRNITLKCKTRGSGLSFFSMLHL